MASRPSAKNSIAPVQQSNGERNYKVYAVNFYGESLEPIRQEYLKNAEDGLRRRVIIIDMEGERRRLLESDRKSTFSQARTSEITAKNSIDVNSEVGAGDAMESSQDEIGGSTLDSNFSNSNMDSTLAIMAIQQKRRLYEENGLRISKERDFDLMRYWMESLQRSNSMGRRKNSLAGRKSIDRDLKKKRISVIKEGDQKLPRIICTKLTPLKHNKIGRPRPLLKRKFIDDGPKDSKLFIILIGKFENEFYIDLLRRGEPLQAIMHLLPGPNSYERLVPNRQRKIFVAQTLQIIEQDLYRLRQNDIMKATGIVRVYVPIISICLALKNSRKIYDQLTWAFYDIELLHRHYLSYYVRPFKEINVEMPESILLRDYYHFAETRNVQGNYLQTPLPSVSADKATIILYMDMLFSTIDQSEGILTEWETILLSTPLPKRLYSIYGESVNTLANMYVDAFYSITKIKKVERLFVEENNTTLVNLIHYVDHVLFRHIYLSCLEYKIQRKYLNNKYHLHSVPFQICNDICNFEPTYLPKYAKIYPTDDGIVQRLLFLLDNYDDYQVTEIIPGHKLYHFVRNFNEVIVRSHMVILPTKLCFRDFTLFLLEDFLADLVTPDMYENRSSAQLTDIERFEQVMKRYAQDYNPDIFIRPQSLKARRMLTVSALLGLKTPTRSGGRRDLAREKELQMAADALKKITNKNQYIGLPPDHHLLKGYNLDDIRQEIWVKTSKYFFEEGFLMLYEERWCFTDTNKNITFKVNDVQLILGTPRYTVAEIQPQIRLVTKNDISLRLIVNPNECANIVLNYPNGLSIYYQEHDTEQLWTRQDTPANERRRIATPFGAIIVEYLSDDVIVVMRYNGEVYRLYQYEFMLSEAEDEDNVFGSVRSWNDRSTIASNKSKILNQMPRNEVNYNDNTERNERGRIPKEALKSKATTDVGAKTKKPGAKHKSAHELNSISAGSSFSMGSFHSDQLERDIISNELDFLKILADHYNLSFKHLIVTNSQGRVFNLTHFGKFYETHPLINEEWHDYYANESYAMREDGVRMIWGIDAMKCYHTDGTVITTQTENIYHRFDNIDEFANAISESSSHQGSEFTYGTDATKKSVSGAAENAQHRFSSRRKRLKSYEPYLKTLGEIEEEGGGPSVDPGYMCTNLGSLNYQHPNYASVYFIPLIMTYNTVQYQMQIKAFDNITIFKGREAQSQEYSNTWQTSYEQHRTEDDSSLFTDIGAAGDASSHLVSHMNSLETQSFQNENIDHDKSSSFFTEKTKTHLTSPAQSDSTPLHTSTTPFSKSTSEHKNDEAQFREDIYRDVIKVWIGDDNYLVVSDEDFELHTLLERLNTANEVIRDMNRFKINFVENPQDVFQKIVAHISSLKRYSHPRKEEIFFLEKTTENGKLKGIELMEQLPDLGAYNKASGNTITQLIELPTVMDKFSNNFESWQIDNEKFPRFRMRSEKRDPTKEFPMVLSVNIYLKIPQSLRCTSEIHKFLDPLDSVNFKKGRYQIKETMHSYMYPHVALEIRKLRSRTNWNYRRQQQQRQKLIVAQRMGLYYAMLRHKTFPNYFVFTHRYKEKAACIDYFDYCLDKCMENEDLTKSAHGKYGKHK